MNHDPIIIDISPFTTTTSSSSSTNHEARKLAAAEIRDKLSINGCVGVKGHGLPDQLLRDAFAMSATMFALPYDDKMTAPHPDATTPHRGYSGPGRENAANKTALETKEAGKKSVYSSTIDFKESYDMGSDQNDLEPNIWLSDSILPGFRGFMTTLYDALHETSTAILDALIMSLDLSDAEAAEIRRLHGGKYNQLRLLHYPPMPEDGNINMARPDDEATTAGSRIGAHKDWSSFTLLIQDAAGGLQYLDRASDTFVDAVPVPGVLYMNIGDMFERFSNGFYPSALHQVVAKQPKRARYSIPYFIGPTPTERVVPQPSLVKRDGGARYEALSVLEYSKKMFEATNKY